MNDKLYRVMLRKTGSLQPGGSTFWNNEVLYCGYDLSEARRTYHGSHPCDRDGGYGNPVTTTQFKCIDFGQVKANRDQLGENWEEVEVS